MTKVRNLTIMAAVLASIGIGWRHHDRADMDLFTAGMFCVGADDVDDAYFAYARPHSIVSADLIVSPADGVVIDVATDTFLQTRLGMPQNSGSRL